MELEGRVALITGAGRRVGRAVALNLSELGCSIAIHYLHSEREASDAMLECRARGAAAETFRADLTEPESPSQLVAEVLARFGRLDVLVNNAAGFGRMSVSDFDLDAWERTLRLNLTAPMALIHAAAEALRAAGGRVVNMCDASTAAPWPDHLAYAVSKGGLETLTRVLARALAPDVNVNGIAIGVAAWPDAYDLETRRRLTDRIPLKRSGTPEDVAAVVRFLLVAGDYLTGAIIPVDGGRSIV